MIRRLSLVLAAFGTAAAVLAAPAAAFAADPAVPVTTTTGYDVSHPQCAGGATAPLPTQQAFALVGVNAGVANTTNPCLAAELAWAAGSNGSTAQPGLALYVNTANPGLAASWWPKNNRTLLGTAVPGGYGTCSHKAGRACGYVYGYSLAEQDLLRTPTPMPPGTRWYLDVEEANTYSSSTAANRAVLEGMSAAFAHAGQRTGLYANRSDWTRFMGVVPPTSRLYRLPTWLAGAITSAGAKANCTHAPLTGGGRILLTQYLPVGAHLDSEVACAKLPHTPKPVIRGVLRAGHRLGATKPGWTSGVTFTYQWRRNGHAISGATHAHYRVRKSDRHALLTVRVIGTRNGYSRAIETSAARRVH